MEQKTMKALVYHGPNSISLDELPVPQIQDPHDVIAKVTCSAICTSDVHIMKGEIPFVKAPRTLGHEFVVEVLEVGSAVKNAKVGGHYAVAPLSYCGECPACKAGHVGACQNAGGFGIYADGCQAEYIRIPWADHCMLPVPAGKTDEDVLLLGDMLATAWFGIQNAGVKEGQTVAVIGCGPVGLSACELLTHHFGCKVVAFDIIQDRIDLVMKQDVAVAAINPATDDVAAKVKEITGGAGFPVVFEDAGTPESLNMAIAIAGYCSVVSTVAVYAGPVSIPMQSLIYKNLRIMTGIQKCEGLPEMLKMIVTGEINTNWILTHHAPLDKIMDGYDVFGNKKDGCVKWVVTPLEG